MNIERERRWLVRKPDLTGALSQFEHILQGYLSARGATPIVRMRVLTPMDRAHPATGPRHGLQTIKVPNPDAEADGIGEIEFGVPVEAAEQCLRVCPAQLEKLRYTLPDPQGVQIEIDVFQGNLYGLVIAEIELADFSQPLQVPEWFGPEITGMRDLSNIALAYAPRAAIVKAAQVWAQHDSNAG